MSGDHTPHPDPPYPVLTPAQLLLVVRLLGHGVSDEELDQERPAS
jgi:hypothetical protein